MDKSTHQIRCEQWLKIINNCYESGMNKTAWCKENGISDKSFFYWQRILRNEAYLVTLVSTTTSVPAVQQLSNKLVDFVEIRTTPTIPVTATSFKPDVVIKHGSTTIEISNSTTPALLQILGGFFNAK